MMQMMSMMTQMMSAWSAPEKKARTHTGPSGGTAMCSVHFKSRSAQSLEDNGQGGFKCKEGMECQVGKGGGKAKGMIEHTYEMCSIHNKKRSSISLIDDGM